MPQILEIKEIDGAAWVRVGRPGDFPSGVALWTPDERDRAFGAEREACALIAQEMDEGNLPPAERAVADAIAAAIRGRTTPQ